MAITKDQVRASAQAFVDTLSKLTAKQREQEPESRLARELNRLIELAEEVAPEIDERLWPVPIKVDDHPIRDRVFGRYADIETAARQIVAQLPTANRPSSV